MSAHAIDGDVILRVAEVCHRLGVSPYTLRRWRQAGLFPQPRRIGPRRLGWPAPQIEAWLSARPEST